MIKNKEKVRKQQKTIYRVQFMQPKKTSHVVNFIQIWFIALKDANHNVEPVYLEGVRVLPEKRK